MIEERIEDIWIGLQRIAHAMFVRSSWIVDDGWARPLYAPARNVPPRTEAAPSLRGTPLAKLPDRHHWKRTRPRHRSRR